ncbi:MAG: transglycosylase SLT domain-containing protein [Elusimicrobia bacterium]|nr:transglycosylase SLT domain-containing protein [Elusimicrobiota bacterium]
MRHPGRLAATLAAIWLLAGAAFAQSRQRSAPAASPTAAQLAERRFALFDGMEGWRALSLAHGEAMAPLSAKLDGIRSSLAALKISEGVKDPKVLGALSQKLEAQRKAFEDWKKELLEALYAGRNSGQPLAGAAPEARQQFTALAEKQAETFRQLAHRPSFGGGQLDELRGRILRAGAPADLDGFFDQLQARSAMTTMPLASAAPAVYGPPADFERYQGQPASVSAEAAAPVVRAQPLARGVGPITFSDAPPSPAAAPVPAAPAADDGPLQGRAAMSNKKSWQVELLKRTGAWALLASVGVDPDTFVASLTGAESGYATDATSWAGAAGVMQIMPETARWIMRGVEYKRIAREYGMTVYNAAAMTATQIQAMLNRDWRTNILLGILYIKDQADSFVGYARQAKVSMEDKAKLMMNMVAGAYNAGPGRVWQALRRLRSQGVSLASVNPSNSLVRIRETRNYVSKILRDYGARLFAETRSENAEPAPARG